MSILNARTVTTRVQQLVAGDAKIFGRFVVDQQAVGAEHNEIRTDDLRRDPYYLGTCRVGEHERTFVFSRQDFEDADRYLLGEKLTKLHPDGFSEEEFNFAIVSAVIDGLDLAECIVRIGSDMPASWLCCAKDRKTIKSCLAYGFGMRWKKKRELWLRLALAFNLGVARYARERGVALKAA